MPINMVKHPHTKFQDLQHKIAQSKTLIALQSTAGAKWSFDSQTSRFFVNILILKYISSFDQGLIMIHQGLLIIHQDSKVAKLGFCRKSQLNFDQAYLSHTL